MDTLLVTSDQSRYLNPDIREYIVSVPYSKWLVCRLWIDQEIPRTSLSYYTSFDFQFSVKNIITQVLGVNPHFVPELREEQMEEISKGIYKLIEYNALEIRDEEAGVGVVLYPSWP